MQEGARPPGVHHRVSTGWLRGTRCQWEEKGLLAGLPGDHAAAFEPVCARTACTPACYAGTPAGWSPHILSAGRASLASGPLGCCAELSSDRMQTEEHAGPREGWFPLAPLSLVPAHEC